MRTPLFPEASRLSWRVCYLSLFLAVFFAFALPGRADFSFVQITDTHVQGIPSAAAQDKRVYDLLGEIAGLSPSPALVVHTGDITESGLPTEFAAFRQMERDALGRISFYAVPGNHDIRWNPLGKSAFPHDAGQRAYRSFDHDTVHFILLDSTVALEHWGHFDQAELDWLRRDLEKAGPGRPIIVGFHHWIGRAPMMVDNEDALLKILAPYNVRLFLIGHGHSDLLWNINGAPAVMAKGLYQGSYNIVRITQDRLQVLRRTDSDRVPTKVLVDVPLRREDVPERSASVKADAGEMTAMLQGHNLPAGTLVTCRVDDEKPISLDAGADGGWSGRFPLSGLEPGVHRVLFTSTLPDSRSYLTPVIVTLAGEHQVVPDWQVNVGAAVQGALTGDSTTVYVPTTGGDLLALDNKTGKTRWRFTTLGALFSPPALSGDLVLFGSADSLIYAIDRTTGKLRWKTPAGAPVFAGTSVSEGVAAVATTDGRILGLDAKSGKLLWTAHGEGMYQSRAATDERHFFVGGWDNYFRCLDVRTGVERWKQKMGKSFHDSPAIGSPTVSDDRSLVFVSSDDGILHALDTATGAVAWETQGALGYSSPLFQGESIFSGSLAEDGSVFRFDAKAGTKQWQHATGSVIYDSSCVAAGADIVVGSVDGTVSALRASDGAIHWQYHLPSGHLFSTAWSGADHIYVANMSGDVAAFPVFPEPTP